MTQTEIDQGKRITAKLPGECAECGGDIVPGQRIYFSRAHGSRHERCVDQAAPGAAAPRAAEPRRDDARGARLWSDETARRWAEGERADDAAPRARDAAAPAADRRDDATQRVPGDAYVAPARATEFGRAGDRDAARRELAELIKLQIDFLNGLLRILA